MEGGSQKPARPQTRDLSDLVVPRRPSGVPYAEGEDYDARELLTVNGYSLETQELIAALGANLSIFQAAAARLLGAKNERTAIPFLSKLAQDTSVEETARGQAAYALARLGVPEGREVLARLIEMNPEAGPAPLQAAGALARLGDPAGFPVVRHALQSSNSVIAMIACKQLYAFAEQEGALLPGGDTVKVYEAFRWALSRPERNITGEAKAQLVGLGTDEARGLLKEFGG